MIHNFFDSSVSITELAEAFRTQHEKAQKTMKPFAEAESSPFDVLPSILERDYHALLQAFYRFQRDIAAVCCYSTNVPPLEFDILKLHSDDDADLQNITNQLTDWIFAFSAGDAHE